MSEVLESKDSEIYTASYMDKNHSEMEGYHTEVVQNCADSQATRTVQGTLEENQTVDYTNSKNVLISTGIKVRTLLLLILMALCMGIGFWYFKKRYHAQIT